MPDIKLKSNVFNEYKGIAEDLLLCTPDNFTIIIRI